MDFSSGLCFSVPSMTFEFLYCISSNVPPVPKFVFFLDVIIRVSSGIFGPTNTMRGIRLVHVPALSSLYLASRTCILRVEHSDGLVQNGVAKT